MPESEVHRVGLAGDDWMSAGSIADLGQGEAVWFAPSGDRAMAFRLRGFRDLTRQGGTLELKTAAKAARFDGDGLKAEFFATADLSGDPAVSRVDPRLWFSDGTAGGEIVAAWAKDGPCPEIPAGKPFSAAGRLGDGAVLRAVLAARLQLAARHRSHADPTGVDGGQRFRPRLAQQPTDSRQVAGCAATNPWQTPPLDLQAGETYDLKVEYAFPGGDGAQFSLVWSTPPMNGCGCRRPACTRRRPRRGRG